MKSVKHDCLVVAAPCRITGGEGTEQPDRHPRAAEAYPGEAETEAGAAASSGREVKRVRIAGGPRRLTAPPPRRNIQDGVALHSP